MKKIVPGLVISVSLLLVTYIYSGIEPSSNNVEEGHDVPFEKAKLVDTQVDGKTGVKVEAYTIEDWED